MVEHTFHPSTWNTEQKDCSKFKMSLDRQHSEYQSSEGYTARLCLKQINKNKILS